MSSNLYANYDVDCFEASGRLVRRDVQRYLMPSALHCCREFSDARYHHFFATHDIMPCCCIYYSLTLSHFYCLFFCATASPYVTLKMPLIATPLLAHTGTWRYLSMILLQLAARGIARPQRDRSPRRLYSSGRDFTITHAGMLYRGK